MAGVAAAKARAWRCDGVVQNILQAFAADAGRSVFEKFGAEFVVEADGFEEMAIAIAGDGGDAHAREDFAQAGFDGDAILGGAAGFQIFGKLHR